MTTIVFLPVLAQMVKMAPQPMRRIAPNANNPYLVATWLK